MNLSAWLSRAPLPANSPARAAVALELGRAVVRLQARLATAPAPVVVEVAEEPAIDLQRPGRRGPYQRRT